MNDLATLKSLTSIRPLATLGNTPTDAYFDKFEIERIAVFGSKRDGIVLTVGNKVGEDILEILEHVRKPIGDVHVRAVVSQQALEALAFDMTSRYMRDIGAANRMLLASDDHVVLRFVTARWQGVQYPIEELYHYFSKLRRAYALSDQAGVISVTARLGSVNHTYTSRAQLEEVLYPMAYHFFQDDTEL